MEASGATARWERVNESRWGRYISAAEKTLIEDAASQQTGIRRAVDTGCGGGRWTRLLVDRGWSVVSTDVDPIAVGVCRDRVPEADVRLIDSNTTSLPVDDHSSSLVICMEVNAVINSQWFLPEVRRVLVPGGHLVAVVWNRRSLRGGVADGIRRVRGSGGHTHYQRSYSSWRRDLKQNGLDVVHEQGLCWFPFSRSSDSALVDAAAFVERRARMNRLISLSPWVLVAAQRAGK